MSLQVYEHAETFNLSSPGPGSLVIYREATPSATRAEPLPWVVARVHVGGHHEVLAGFALRADAICFVLAYSSHGWPASDVLRDAASAVIRARHSPQLEDRLQDLAAALGTVAPPPRVLIVVDRGVARAYATPGVLVATADLDSKRLFAEDELAPIHTDFAELLQLAEVIWPLSPWGRRQSATVLPSSYKETIE